MSVQVNGKMVTFIDLSVPLITKNSVQFTTQIFQVQDTLKVDYRFDSGKAPNVNLTISPFQPMNDHHL